MDEQGNYSFDAVENAQYYYVYIYDSESSVSATAQSGKIPDDGSASYSGNVNDFARLTYEDWSVRVTAYPDFDNSDLAASPEAKATYVRSGAVDPGEPGFYYMWTVVSGTLEIFADGTFKMEIEYQYIRTDMMNAAVYYVPGVICEGTWTQNADGTINLSYDHENAYETDYAIVTELTGQAKAYYEANPDAAGSSTASGEASGEASQESASNEPEPMADGSGEAAADNG